MTEHQSPRERREATELAHIVERLVDRFPEIPRSELEDLVHGKYRDFETASVRDFVPVLVERKASRSLRTPRHRA